MADAVTLLNGLCVGEWHHLVSGRLKQAGFIMPISLLLMWQPYILHFYYKYIPIIDYRATSRSQRSKSQAGPWSVSKRPSVLERKYLQLRLSILWPPKIKSDSIIEAKQRSWKIAFDIVVSPTSELCDIYFRNPAGQAKTVKTKAGLQMLKPSAACVHVYVHVYIQ